MRPVARTVILLASLGGCFHWDSVNQRPAIDIIPDSSAPVFRGDHVILHANAHDPENHDIKFVWNAFLCTDATAAGGCDPDPFYTGIEPDAEFDVSPFRADPDGVGPAHAAATSAVLVVLEARDELGATARPAQELVIPVLDHAPTVTLDQARLYNGVVRTPVRVFARYTDGDDPLDRVTIEWKAFSPTQTMFALEPVDVAPDPDPAFRQVGVELIADVTGDWDIQVTATDPLGNSVTEHITVVIVPDRAPCLSQWSPIAPTGGALYPLAEPTLFQVPLVDDDLDPYPQGVLDPFLDSSSFVWSILPPGGTRTVLPDVTSNSMALDPATFPPGSVVELRVEIFDRKATPISCADGDQTCSTISTSCIQRQTWHLEVL